MSLEQRSRILLRGLVVFVVALVVLVFVGGAVVVAFGGNLGPTLVVLFTVIAAAVAVLAVRAAR